MQRMRLHVQGVKLPALGSAQDSVLRQYAFKEAALEAKRTEFAMLTLLTNPTITDDTRWREWKDSVQGVWKTYVAMLYNTELPEEDIKDRKLLEYYNNVVKKSDLKMYKDKQTGQLRLSGTERLFS